MTDPHRDNYCVYQKTTKASEHFTTNTSPVIHLLIKATITLRLKTQSRSTFYLIFYGCHGFCLTRCYQCWACLRLGENVDGVRQGHV